MCLTERQDQSQLQNRTDLLFLTSHTAELWTATRNRRDPEDAIPMLLRGPMMTVLHVVRVQVLSLP